MTTAQDLTVTAMFSRRARAIDSSGIRRIFELGATLKNPYNFSIGQPDFPVPREIKAAAINAIESDQNGYTVTQGIGPLRDRAAAHLRDDVGWHVAADDRGLLVASGTSGALYLAFLALMDPGDEAIIGDPYFVIYPELATLTGATPILCDTYPDGRLTAERVEPLITDRTKMLVVNSPGNPTGVVLSNAELRDLVALCEQRGVLLVSDEIYDQFVYDEAREENRCPSPARFTDQMLLVRGFGKTFGCTGWRLGYAAGPRMLIEEMAKLQQYTFVCAPAPLQHAALAAFDLDMRHHVAAYQGKRDRVVGGLGDVADIIQPGGAFYAFVKVPERLGMSGTEFAERAIERNVLVIPGGAFSQRDTHFRLSYAVSDQMLDGGLPLLRDLLTVQN